MYTYTRTGKEENNDTSKKQKKRKKELFPHKQRDRSHQGLLLLFFA
jgi:hypothetical protein